MKPVKPRSQSRAGAPRRRRARLPRTSVPVIQSPPAAVTVASASDMTVEPVDAQLLTRPQIFSFIWLALVACYVFHGPRGHGAFPTEVAFLITGVTIYSLVVLGKRFPTFGAIMAMFFAGLLSGLCSGGRRGRRW
jgi:hypothetical protein